MSGGRSVSIGDLRRGELTVPWYGYARDCTYTEEEFAPILAAIPHECPYGEIKAVVQEIAGYFSICVRTDAEKAAELERTDRFASRIKYHAERDAYREAARLAFDPRPTDTRDQLKTLLKNLPPVLKALQTFTPAAAEMGRDTSVGVRQRSGLHNRW